MKLYEKTAAELSEMLRNKKCSAAEILNDVNERIKAAEGKIGAYVTLNNNAAEEARAVDESIARGESVHPLAGIPIAVKDNISTRGIRTTCSSRMLENYIPPFDASAVERIKNAGMIITGKTNTDEFAMGSTTETSYMHPTRNPHNTDYVPGGSSGGSAAAVAAGETIVALGSDTGGSVRQPAALCGAVGIKPTYGRVSRYGLIAYASSLEQIGAIGKSVRDAAMVLDLISGHDPMDATSAISEKTDYALNLRETAKGLRIGVPDEYFSENIDDDVKEAVYGALKLLESEGAQIKRISLPDTQFAVNAYYIIASAEASSNLARYDGVKYGYRAENFDGLTDMYEKTRSEGFGNEVKRRIMLGTFVLSSGCCDKYYKRAKLMQQRISEEFSEAFTDCDVIAAPSYPCAAFRIGESAGDPVEMYSRDICTVTANIAGLPAISVPCGKNSAGLPLGMQLIGNKFAEQIILDAANAYEKICGGFNTLAANL
ncbi:MAG: Asp-tRNA(Asn)/Glu-tRNA(Gln) amidotransferase subunit GatA [Ruminococcus sp.]|nr:Asp-tRNA(Asn)/Glu-tRNA(Gln) amidotransferase subunit GatA [Ruminococcus sp.]